MAESSSRKIMKNQVTVGMKEQAMRKTLNEVQCEDGDGKASGERKIRRSTE